MRPIIDDANAPTGHSEQIYEMNGHRGFYRDGWEVVSLHQPLTPFSDGEWELYHLAEDPNELHDQRADHPEKLQELAGAWEEAAWAGQIYPLDEGTGLKYVLRPPSEAAFREPVTIYPGTPTLERYRSAQLVGYRGARVEIPIDFEVGDRGYLVAHGDQGSGYGVYVLDDQLRFVHNDGRGVMRECSGGRLTAGPRLVELVMTAPGNMVWDVQLLVDGVVTGELADLAMLFGLAPFEGIDVGIDRRSPVSWEIYERFGPFPYSGVIHHVRYVPGDPAPDSPDVMMDVLREMGSKFD